MSVIVVDPPLGPAVVAAEVPYPARRTFSGTSVTLEPLAVGHVPNLWVAAGHADASWTYLRYGPFRSEADLRAHVERIGNLPLQPFFAILPAVSGKAEGWASFCDIATATPRSRSAAFGSRRVYNAPVRRPKRSS